MSNKKRAIFYVIELVGLLAFIFFARWLSNYLEKIGETNFDMMPSFIFQLIYPIFFGALTRVPALISRRHTNHRFDMMRFLIVAVPGLFLIGQFLVSLLFETKILFMFVVTDMFMQLVGFFAGAVTIDCIKGKSNANQEVNASPHL